ncbi:MAG: hypothetical protein EBR82_66815 [Caulobacteraceae bacterium]|nr:hypothetical protein [Caulobacteraceae bacterium]
MTAETKDTLMGIMERWGFPTLVAVGLAFFIRQDLLMPLLEEHRLTLKEVRETQREIADAVNEQTRLLIAIQSGKPVGGLRTVDATEPGDGRN